jgi:hypothetical protein
MQNNTPVNDIAQRVGATSEDIAALGPLWQGMMRRDENGRLWVSKDREHFLLGALDAEADCRKDQRIKDADAELVATYRDLMRAGRRSAPGLQGAAHHQKQTLERVNRVLDALVELVDAKVDRQCMKSEAAAQIRSEVDALRRDAQQNGARALEAIRSLLDLSA